MHYPRDAARHAAAAVVLKDVELGYASHPPVLTIPSLELPGHGLVALVGPNGGGKSTLLAAIAGLHPPRRGTITRSAAVACAFQQQPAQDALPLTVAGLVGMGRWGRIGLVHRPGQADRRAVETAMEQLGILDLRRSQLRELSVGQRRRAHIAMALAQDTPILLLDEPTAGLDADSRERVAVVLVEEARHRLVVVATHDQAEGDLADMVVTVADSTCTLHTTPVLPTGDLTAS
ncbi:metal ABC transporter ATP-binding protein [Euzebya tangerina]|uniref:metal ABC transporter ATP-binding protein n=1 Tax=Euzebya tangerina TaxID=591198 RepID=UPI000E31895D|nr:ATP-binding cassette domain-containing protein [Euzebya tangerina]